MKWKICGMRDQENIKQVLGLEPDFMGFIFYKKSPRFVSEEIAIKETDFGTTKKVGVFVNENNHFIIDKVQRLALDYVQLHGDESNEQVIELSQEGIKVIRAMRVENELPTEQLAALKDYVDFFLFDTKSAKYGGSGKRFDWQILTDYHVDKPFLLSGGIGRSELNEIMEMNIPQLYGIDLNSKCETEPGIKNPKLIKEIRDSLTLSL